jgi:hypothetical protein
MRFLEISWDFGILGFSKIFGFFQRFFWIFDEVYEDFQSNLPLVNTKMMPMCGGIFTHLLDLTRSSCEKCNYGPLAGIEPAALQFR